VEIPIPPPFPISKKRSKKSLLRKKLEKLADEKRSSSDSRRSTAGIVLGNILLHGIGHYIDVRIREEAMKELFNVVAFEMGVAHDQEKAVSFDEVAEALEMVGKISTEEYSIGAKSFSTGIDRRVKWDAKAPERAKKLEEKKSKEHLDVLERIEARRRILQGRR
jgi:hypothetical protein